MRTTRFGSSAAVPARGAAHEYIPAFRATQPGLFYAVGRLGAGMAVEERVTFCRICEPLCGMVATVEDGRLTQLRPDREHPLSRGYACPKGIALEDIQNDPDRVLHPLRRTAAGRVRTCLLGGGAGRHRGEAAKRPRRTLPRISRLVPGQPGGVQLRPHDVGEGLPRGIGTQHFYSAGSQDINSRFAAQPCSTVAAQVPFPDLERTDFLLILGANPLVSHGSALNAPRIKDQLSDIVKRGGRVVVVDPRHTETARHSSTSPSGPTPTHGCCSRCCTSSSPRDWR